MYLWFGLPASLTTAIVIQHSSLCGTTCSYVNGLKLMQGCAWNDKSFKMKLEYNCTRRVTQKLKNEYTEIYCDLITAQCIIIVLGH